jgi:hypothetical protein
MSRMSSLLLCCALLAVPALSGCVIHGRASGAVVVDAEPPPPRYVRVEYRPGYVWLDGHWAYRGSRWVWVDGYYVTERPGHVYVQGRWVRRSGRWHWVEPRWERGHARRDDRRGPAVRDHRGRTQPAVRDHRGGPVKTRDHRNDKVKPRDHRDDKGKARDHRKDDDEVRDHRDDKVKKRDHRR